jgi:probable HAF family extracellular repeat protein
LSDLDSRCQAEGISDAGEVVGLCNDNDDRAFYWTAAGGMIELPTLTGIESGARAINSVGQVAGYGDIDTGDAHAVVWNRDTDPPTPEERIEALESAVEGLVASGSLKPGQANGLLSPLGNASRSLERGRLDAACSQLGDFQLEVARKVRDGALTAAQGEVLIASATSIRVALGCG